MSEIFEISQEIIDQIIFAMEDQEKDFVVDIFNGSVIEKYSVEKSLLGTRFIDVPRWRPIDGFRLMEKFVSKLKNPVYRNELLEALATGKKVFRNFKNILKTNPSVERKWYIFKSQELKRIIYDWYNTLREIHGLEKILIEEENTEDLVLTDFVFAEWNGEHREELEDLYRQACAETNRKSALDMNIDFSSIDNDSVAIVLAFSPAGEIVGFILGIIKNNSIVINQLYVRPDYRGLGIANCLLGNFIERVKGMYDSVFADIPGTRIGITKIFERIGFHIYSQRLKLEL